MIPSTTISGVLGTELQMQDNTIGQADATHFHDEDYIDTHLLSTLYKTFAMPSSAFVTPEGPIITPQPNLAENVAWPFLAHSPMSSIMEPQMDSLNTIADIQSSTENDQTVPDSEKRKVRTCGLCKSDSFPGRGKKALCLTLITTTGKEVPKLRFHYLQGTLERRKLRAIFMKYVSGNAEKPIKDVFLTPPPETTATP
ncbi:hypothetical protein DFS34DRAFT_590906 [Phlyctochytrium arcticum]|nr:hypothetical protein DFS34DRAFT_590906 [Phlyctochytrium arcticum]